MTTQDKPQQPLQQVIVDTNVIRYISKKEIAPILLNYLKELISRGFGLSISAITQFEMLEGAPKEKEKDILAKLSLFKNYQIDFKVLVLSSWLSTLYNKESTIQNDQSSVADKIIASTAALTGSIILTADVNDFPRPFFKEVEEKLIIYKEKNKTKLLVLQLLSPDKTVINYRFQSRP